MNIFISEETYQEIIRHLEINAETDASAKILLDKLKQEAKPSPKLSSGAFIIDGNSQKPKYSV